MRMKKQRRSLAEGERFAGLAALLERPDAGWREAIDMLARWPSEQDAGRAVEVVEAAVERWPAHTRGLSRLVIQQLLANEVRPYLRLIRTLDLRLLWRVQRRDVLLARMIAEGGVVNLLALTTRYDVGEGLIALVVRHVRGLRSLHIGASGVTSAGGRMLARAPGLAGLTSLSLYGNRIEDDGAEALLESPHLHGLRYLNVYGNRLTWAMVPRLCEAPQWREGRVIAHNQRSPGSLGY